MAYYAVYKNRIENNITKLKKAFSSKKLDFQLFYSVKTNYCSSVLRTIKESKSEFEIISQFEWEKVKNFLPRRLVLNGPAKDKKTIKDILEKMEALYINIDNDSDFNLFNKLERKLLNKVKLGIRIFLNSDGIWNRFGYDITNNNFKRIISKVNSIKKLSGIHFHFSTNNFKIVNYQILLSKIFEVTKKSKIKLEFLDIGGGLPAANEFIYEQDVYEKLPKLLSSFFPNTKIICEAGRNIVSDTIDLVSKIISKKEIGKNKFQVNVDTNIMHFQCFFEKKFWVEYKLPNKYKNQPTKIEIFGNSCMQIDRICDSMLIDRIPEIGDEIIIHNVGAYSYSQAANFISPIPEVKTYE